MQDICDVSEELGPVAKMDHNIDGHCCIKGTGGERK